MKKGLPTIIFYLIIIIFWEMLYRIAVFNDIFNIGLFHILTFLIPLTLFLTLLSRLFTPTINKIFTWLMMLFLTFLYAGQFLFITMFSVPFTVRTISLIDQAADNLSVALNVILKHGLVFILMFIPLIFLIIIRKKLHYEPLSNPKKLLFLGCFAFFLASAFLFVLPGKEKTYSSYKVLYEVDAPNLLFNRFGVLTSTLVDLNRSIFGFEEKLDLDIDDIIPPLIDKEFKYNITEIDFAGLINNTTDEVFTQMHTYFASEEATKQNEYTGLFKDKNLIFIVAEGFNEIAVSKTHTPTLYKLVNSSFVFENYYTPVILSTVGGEMQALLGLIPTMETINYWKNNKPTFPYAIGNSFRKEGYVAKAYHNHSYTYYDREKTRPTIGFSDYLGCGNGLEKLMSCKNWPNSDIDLIEAVSNQFIGTGIKQVTYILTVSGHANYGWGGNYIARKNKELVADLPYSEEVKGYIATQIELDKALELLLKKLEEADELDNTVIALVGDHYPYNFTIEQVNELALVPKDKKIEVNRSNFILYNSEVKTTKVSKLSSQIDVLPTLLNLFGIEYDSRLIIGKDIFSEAPGLVMFSDRSWLSEYGLYSDGNFTPKEGVSIPEDYVTAMNKIVANKFAMSKLLIQKDYYNIVLK